MPNIAELSRFVIAIVYSSLFWLGVLLFLDNRRSGWFSLKFVATLMMLVFGTLFYGVVTHGILWTGPAWLRMSMSRLFHP